MYFRQMSTNRIKNHKDNILLFVIWRDFQQVRNDQGCTNRKKHVMNYHKNDNKTNFKLELIK